MEQVSKLDEKVRVVLADILQVPAATITDDLAMQDVDAWNSLKHMEVIASLEDTFCLQLNFEEIVTMQSVANIKRVLNGRGVFC